MRHDSGETSTSRSSQRTQTPLKPLSSYKPKTGTKMVSTWCFPKTLLTIRDCQERGTRWYDTGLLRATLEGTSALTRSRGRWVTLWNWWLVIGEYKDKDKDKEEIKWSWTLISGSTNWGPWLWTHSRRGNRKGAPPSTSMFYFFSTLHFVGFLFLAHFSFVSSTITCHLPPGVQHDSASIWPGHPLPLLWCQRPRLHPRPERPRTKGFFSFCLCKICVVTVIFPQFQTHKYWVDIPEDTPGGTPVLQVTTNISLNLFCLIIQTLFPHSWKGCEIRQIYCIIINIVIIINIIATQVRATDRDGSSPNNELVYR